METKDKCCDKSRGSVKKGILYGILPHSFCIAFIALSIIGATTATTLLRPFMLNSFFFPSLVVLSFFLASVSAIIYLTRGGRSISISNVLSNKKYLLTLYTTVIGINLILFLVIFPLVANYSFGSVSANTQTNVETKTISVDIPCSGHAPLIMGEVKKNEAILGIRYIPLNNFEIKYDPQKTSLQEILSLPIFQSFKAKEV